MRFPTVVCASAAMLLILALPSNSPAELKRMYWLMKGDWASDYPEAVETVKVHPDKPADWEIEGGELLIDDFEPQGDPPQDYNLLIVTGHEAYTFTAEERDKLETFVREGGTLWIDDCGGIELDNLPLEIDFAHVAWGTCSGTDFTVLQPGHPLLHTLYDISDPAGIRTDVSNHFFSGFTAWDPELQVIMQGDDTSDLQMDGPAVLVGHLGCGNIVASAMDITCALEAYSYGTFPAPSFDFRFVLNLLKYAELGSPSAETGGEQTVCAGLEFRLDGSSSGYSICHGQVQYQWEDERGRILRSWSPFPTLPVTRYVPGTYTYTLRMRCNQFPECEFADTLQLNVDDCTTPVVYTSYDASRISDETTIRWTTAMESEVLGFVIETAPVADPEPSRVSCLEGLTPARGSGHRYETRHRTDAPLFYRIREVKSNGAPGGVTPFFAVPSGGAVNRRR